jgi:hypothetical protein
LRVHPLAEGSKEKTEGVAVRPYWRVIVDERGDPNRLSTSYESELSHRIPDGNLVRFSCISIVIGSRLASQPSSTFK